MKECDVREGDIVIVDESLSCFSPRLCREPYLAMILWRGIGGQPLVTEISKYSPTWTCYRYIAGVVEHNSFDELLERPLSRAYTFERQVLKEYEDGKREEEIKETVKRYEKMVDSIDKNSTVSIDDLPLIRELAQKEINRLEEK